MYSVSVFDAPLGSIIAEPIYMGNTLLINKGVSLSNNLKYALFNFGIKSISVEGTFSEKIDESKLRFGSFDNLTYIAVRTLDFNKISVCARTMVEALREGNSLMELLCVYDNGTLQHSINVAALALSIGIALNLSIRELERLAMGALLHDIGKMRIPSEILNKVEKLTDEEIATLREHPYLGVQVIDELNPETGSTIKQIVWQHHEDFDGNGYPRKLTDFHIYRLARIVHICDVYDALCSKRAYKEAFPKELVWEIMDSYSGNKFDPFIYRKFREIIPYYLLGEEIVIGDSVGIVVDVDDKIPNNPKVWFNGAVLPWSQLSAMNKEKIARLRGSEGILHLEKVL